MYAQKYYCYWKRRICFKINRAIHRPVSVYSVSYSLPFLCLSFSLLLLYLSVFLSPPSLSVSSSLSTFFLYLSFFVSLYLSLNLSLYRYVYIPMYLSIYASIYLSIFSHCSFLHTSLVPSTVHMHHTSPMDVTKITSFPRLTGLMSYSSLMAWNRHSNLNPLDRVSILLRG